jgi:multimeric flavodoxin WrbA
LIALGSPRQGGNSATLATQVVAGAEAAGAQVEVLRLHDLDIRPCRGCNACHKGTERNCVVEDDMQALYPKLREVNVLVVASPVYWFTVSAQTKLFMDRWYALESPQGNALAGKRVGIVLTYGDSDPFNSGAVNALRTFQDAFGYIGAEIVGTVYGSADKPGEIAENQALMDRAYRLGERLVSKE